jgi:Family of unknown function (DUF6788)
MQTVPEIEGRRDEVLQQMRSIRSMKRGTINEQYLKVPQKGAKPALRGPYYVLSRREGNKTVSERLTTPTQLEQAKMDVAAHRKFVELCKEFEVLTERLGMLQRQGEGDEEKKRLRRLSKQIEK